MAETIVPTAGLGPLPAPSRAGQASKVAPSANLGFYLFLLINALLIIRPGDIYPPLRALHLYELTMIACLAIHSLRLLSQLSPKVLRARPITFGVLVVWLLVCVSTFWNGYADLIAEYTVEFTKVMLYYLLLTVVIRDAWRLRVFVVFLAGCILVAGLASVLDYHHVIEIEPLKILRDVRTDPTTGQEVRFDRLVGLGIFNDPNDLAQILGVGIVLCIYAIEHSIRRTHKAVAAQGSRVASHPLVHNSLRWVWRIGWGLAALVMLYGIYLTQSRGGLMAMGFGLLVLLISRVNLKLAIPLGIMALVGIAVLFGGRQTELTTADGSAQSRVQLWAEAINAIKENPILGIGAGSMGTNYMTQVAHNTFLHMFGELGLIGGVAFLGAYYTGIWGLLRILPGKTTITDPILRTLHPYLVAAVAAYAMGMMSLSRGYVLTTYTLLGMATVLSEMVSTRTKPAVEPLRLNGKLVRRILLASMLFLVAMYLFVRVSVRW